MNKLTDNEIVKALECCIDCKCKECPCYKNIEGEMHCTEIDEEEILDLINRKKAEIESLKADKIIAERHEKDARELYKDVVIQLKTAKSEAIKEFAERLKDKVYYCEKRDNTDNFVIDEMDIDNLVKEMTEVSE